MKDFLGMIDPLPLRLGGIVRSDPGEVPLRNPIEDFEKRDWGKGLEPPKQAPTKQPATQFKVGDRVKCTYTDGYVAEGRIKHASLLYPGEWSVEVLGRNDGIFRPDQLELLPSEQPKVDADGWVEWDARRLGRPDLSRDTKIALKVADGSVVWAHGLSVNHANWTADSSIRAYRLIP